MSTLDQIPFVVHHSIVAESAGSATGNRLQPVIVIVIFIAVLMMGAALKQVRRAFAPIGELVRLVVSALTVAALLVGAVAVLVGGLVISAGAP